MTSLFFVRRGRQACALPLAAAALALSGISPVSAAAVTDPSAARDTRLPNAAKSGNGGLVRSLLGQADVNAALDDGTTALHFAAASDDPALVALLLKAGANPKAATRVGAVTPLTLAAQSGDPASVAALLKAGADPNTPTENGTTPLMFAAASGSAETVTVLLDHGAKIDAKETIYGQTALMFAAAKNRASVLRTLLRRGADPKLTSTVSTLARQRVDDDGNPIGTGTAAGSGRAATAGGTGPVVDTAGVAATTGAAGANGGGRRRGRGNGATATASPAPQTAAGESPAPAAEDTAGAVPRGFGGRGPQGPARTFGGNTALTLAAREGNIAALHALVESGVDVNEGNAGDKTPPLSRRSATGITTRRSTCLTTARTQTNKAWMVSPPSTRLLTHNGHRSDGHPTR